MDSCFGGDAGPLRTDAAHRERPQAVVRRPRERRLRRGRRRSIGQPRLARTLRLAYTEPGRSAGSDTVGSTGLRWPRCAETIDRRPKHGRGERISPAEARHGPAAGWIAIAHVWFSGLRPAASFE